MDEIDYEIPDFRGPQMTRETASEIFDKVKDITVAWAGCTQNNAYIMDAQQLNTINALGMALDMIFGFTPFQEIAQRDIGDFITKMHEHCTKHFSIVMVEKELDNAAKD